MYGYSKIKLIRSTKSRSLDFEDLLSLPTIPKPTGDQTIPNTTSFTLEETKQIKTTDYAKNTNTHESLSELEEDEGGRGERFGDVLRRNFSVSSAASHRKESLQSAVKKAFSMRRSSSVSERYCRIHDQCVALSSPFEDDDDDDDEVMDKSSEQTRSVKKKKKQGRTAYKLAKT
ncbi:uncharacterized protein LOC127802047 isoform X2 [Diospyros lotus]|uniref:uncharacterized protein LOC127802047 isoform X2 n=1 Tax=Diospyros lotus TaxID=55363 RepID=UPI00224C9A6A|nr:uncharacterized protein LOC127802047 isoform X2 [Diospyros lotus]